MDDFNNIVFNDLEEETNDAKEFDEEFVNLKEANWRCPAKRKSVAQNDDNDNEYCFEVLESVPESDGKGGASEKEKFSLFVPQFSMHDYKWRLDYY